MHDRSGEIRSTRAPALREHQTEILGRYGKRRKTEAEQVLFRAGDATGDFVVVLEGEVEVIDDFAGEARTMGVMRQGRFLGDLNMLTGQPIYLSAVVRVGGEVLAISRERLKEVVTEESNLSDIILKAFLARRSWEMRNGGRPHRGTQGGGQPEKGRGRPLPHRALRGRRGRSPQRDSRQRGPLPEARRRPPRAFRGRERP